MAKPIKINNGQKFNRWTVIKEVESHKQPNGKLVRMFLCKCDCKNESIVSLLSLRNNTSKSCGCYMKEINGNRIGKMSTTHGNTVLSGNEYKSLFFVWNNMKQRCYNQNSKKYSTYGAKGIKICDEWINNFINFRDWSIKNGYFKQSKEIKFKDKLSIDRIDSTKDYCPENCQWITVGQNSSKRHKQNN